MSLSVSKTALSFDYRGEKTHPVCKTLTHNPNIGAIVLLFPKERERAAFQYIRVTYLARSQRMKFYIREHKLFPATFIGEWENKTFATLYDLMDVEMCWMVKIHSKGLQGILSLIPVIFSAHLAFLENTKEQTKPV